MLYLQNSRLVAHSAFFPFGFVLLHQNWCKTQQSKVCKRSLLDTKWEARSLLCVAKLVSSAYWRPQSKEISQEGKKEFFLNKIEQNFAYYVSGFVDGEGCFSVSFRKNSKLNFAIEVRASFSIAQKKTKTNYILLEKIRSLFQGGAIRDDGRGCYKYESRSTSHLIQKIIPFFITYPLYTSKAFDFSCFREVCSLIASKQHLSKAGLLKILTLAESMNLSGKRRFSINELQALLHKKL